MILAILSFGVGRIENFNGLSERATSICLVLLTMLLCLSAQGVDNDALTRLWSFQVAPMQTLQMDVAYLPWFPRLLAL